VPSPELRYCEPMSDEMNIDEKFARLQAALKCDHGKEVQDAMFDLGAVRNDRQKIPDEIVERLLTLLRSEEMYKSRHAGHVLNFFEFQSASLTDRQKWLCIGFLNAHGDEFSDVYSQQVVTELRHGMYGDYLRMKKPTAQQWKDYQKMQGNRDND
jgi:hypothetical protein